MSMTADIVHSIIKISFIGLLALVISMLVVYFYSRMLTSAEGIRRFKNEDEENSIFYALTLKPRVLSGIFFTHNLKSKHKKTQRALDVHNFLVKLFWLYVICFILLVIILEQ